jgi:hypothetical protein
MTVAGFTVLQQTATAASYIAVGIWVAVSSVRSDGYYGPLDFTTAHQVVQGNVNTSGNEWFGTDLWSTNKGPILGLPAAQAGSTAFAVWSRMIGNSATRFRLGTAGMIRASAKTKWQERPGLFLIKSADSKHSVHRWHQSQRGCDQIQAVDADPIYKFDVYLYASFVVWLYGHESTALFGYERELFFELYTEVHRSKPKHDVYGRIFSNAIDDLVF